ncbi:MAG: SDR family oxidoreductase [Gemmatimonadetes bacterium]|nr:SDR family oxidoreductase [Gemmatimonadota bacterium]
MDHFIAGGAGTAFITGASSGIGATFARTLAERGHGLILTARREERLQALAGELRERFGVHAEVVPADLTRDTDLDRLVELVSGREDLSYLVNNAGFGTMGRFVDIDAAKPRNMLRVHCEAAVRLSHAALPGMIALGRAAIINVSSVAGFVAAGGSAMYGSTKAFLIAFSEALGLELRDTEVRVQALCPGFTYTEFHDSPEFKARWDRSDIPKMLWLSAERVVHISLRALDRNRPVCVTGFRYRLIIALARNPLMRPLLRRFSKRRER